MFSQACVKNSVHRLKGACMSGGVGCVWRQGGMCGGEGGAFVTEVHGRGHAWWGNVHVSGCVHGRVACVAGGFHCRRDDHCSRRYASYWNAFLFSTLVFFF